MQNIKLIGTDITTTSLGFGCAGLMRTITSNGRQKLLNTAYDAGIRHYDVARMYGLGQVEAEVGKFIKGRRDQVVIATKFGIEVNQRSSRLAPLMNMARLLIKIFPSIRKMANKKTTPLYQDRHYDALTAQACLEKSLSELKTDYIDMLFLHEPALANLENIEILDFLERAKDKGMIRAYGIAGYTQDCLDICNAKPELIEVLQIPNDMIGRQLERFDNVFSGSKITFSPFSNALNKIMSFLNNDSKINKSWSDAVGYDCSSSSVVADFLLKYCVDQNSDGVVLCSTSNASRLSEMVNGIDEGRINNDALGVFTSLVQSEFDREVL